MSTKNCALLKLASLALAASLCACGGGSDKAESAAAALAPLPAKEPALVPPSVNATGVLTEGLVEGLAFSASPSGLKGTTNAKGEFSYAAGDTISFTLGGLRLGSVSAAARVTPVEMAAGNADKLKNLWVLLQSLDSDGVPGNGITIPAKAAEAIAGGIDLTQAPASFASSANAGLTAAMAAGSISRAITDIAKAEEDFLAQAKQLLSRHVWLATMAEPASEAGEFVHGAVVNNSSSTDRSGFEYGTAMPTLLGAHGFKLSHKIAMDTKGEAGFSSNEMGEDVRAQSIRKPSFSGPMASTP